MCKVTYSVAFFFLTFSKERFIHYNSFLTLSKNVSMQMLHLKITWVLYKSQKPYSYCFNNISLYQCRNYFSNVSTIGKELHINFCISWKVSQVLVWVLFFFLKSTFPTFSTFFKTYLVIYYKDDCSKWLGMTLTYTILPTYIMLSI